MGEYERVRDSLYGHPITWYPALLRFMLEIIVDNRIFNGRDGLLSYINKVLDRKEAIDNDS